MNENQIDLGNGVHILTIFRNGSLTAAPHMTHKAACAAFVEYIKDDVGYEDIDEDNVDDEDAIWQNVYDRGAELIESEGGLIEIIFSPVFGGKVSSG